MTRWFRFYDDAINDAKILGLSDALFRAWVTLLCLASKNGGALPPAKDISLVLRMKQGAVGVWLAGLFAAGLLDKREDGSFVPHNWEERQYRSDSSAERMKRHRDKKRDVTCDDDGDVTVTVQNRTETDTETEQISEAVASDAGASDPRTRLFNEGLGKLASLTGKGPDACRSFVGKCLKASGDDAIIVLGLIEEAERNRVVDPSAWIAARLKGPQNGTSKIIQAADDLRRKIASFDGPASGDRQLRSGEVTPALRLLPHG